MPCANTPTLETPRLILRRFVLADLEDLLLLYGDPQVNTFLPWFPLSTLEEARTLYQTRYAAAYQAPRAIATPSACGRITAPSATSISPWRKATTWATPCAGNSGTGA